MSNKTKRDVFEKALREWDDLVHSCGLQGEEAHGGCEFDPILIKYNKDYAAALPDDLPVIPEAVGDILRLRGKINLLDVLVTAKSEREVGDTLAWIIYNQNTFASAWVLGIWRVEETGEIIKLDETGNEQ